MDIKGDNNQGAWALRRNFKYQSGNRRGTGARSNNKGEKNQTIRFSLQLRPSLRERRSHAFRLRLEPIIRVQSKLVHECVIGAAPVSAWQEEPLAEIEELVAHRVVAGRLPLFILQTKVFRV